LSPTEALSSIQQGAGDTVGKVGVIIVSGSVIGCCLERSGGAAALATTVLELVGERHAFVAVALVGVVVSVAVFADCGLLLCYPVCCAIARKANLSHQLLFLSLAMGLLTTHSMVPPTPGPIAAAAALKADLSLVFLYGSITSLSASLVSAAYARSLGCASWFVTEAATSHASRAEEARAMGTRAHLASAFVTIALPIVLISVGSISAAIATDGEGPLALRVLGTPSVALLAGVSTALAFLIGVRRPARAHWPLVLNEGLSSAAPIVLLTGMGGGLGAILRDTGMTGAFLHSSPASRLGLWLAVLLASALKVAQGSGTVAITVAASIMAPLMDEAGLGDRHSRALTVVALGAGSVLVVHVNDSFFWVFTRLIRCEVKQGLKLMTPASLVLGTSSAVMVWLLHLQLLAVVTIVVALSLALLATSTLGRCCSQRAAWSSRAAGAVELE